MSVVVLGGLSHGELGSGVYLEAVIGDGHPAFHRETVGAVREPLNGPVQGGEAPPEAAGDGDAHGLVLERLSAIGVTVPGLLFSVVVLLARLLRGRQQTADPLAFGGKKSLGPVNIHVDTPSSQDTTHRLGV